MKPLILIFLSLHTFLLGRGSEYQAKVDIRYQDKNDSSEWGKVSEVVNISFASKDTRYSKHNIPALNSISTAWETVAWRGERVNTQFLIWSTRKINNVNFKIGNLKDDKGNQINASFIKANFILYVITDGLNAEGGGCGIQRNHDSSLVADVIDNRKSLSVEMQTTQPVWLSVAVPQATPPGLYHSTLKVMEGPNTLLRELKFSIQVINQMLPTPDQWTFHLDLWQNPYSIARVYNVKPWSNEHMVVMRPYMKRLAEAGQKAVTASIIHDPWNGQTFDIYQSMIQWVKKEDGTWFYDYSIFDKWVSYMNSVGINKIINCYSLIPWNLKFYYYDETIKKDTFLIAKPGSTEYKVHWSNMLQDFAKHLKAKKWFAKTSIAMDERPLQDMLSAIDVIKSVDKDFKISLAGNFHPEIESNVSDYSIASNQIVAPQTIEERKQKGRIITYYTCCTEGFPNTFTFSPPAESAWLAFYSAKKDFDGYLRWAYNCWTNKPLIDSRFGSWSAGDAFLVYPGNRSSFRLERLIEGIQDFEKIQILKRHFQKTDQKDNLTKLNSILDPFELENLKTEVASDVVEKAHKSINNLSVF